MQLFRAREPNYILVTSSLAFAVPSLVAYTYGQYLTSQICSLLLMSSIQYHGQPSQLSFLLDQLMILVFVVRGIYVGYLLGFYGLLVAAFLNGYSIFIYYGPWSHSFAYHPNNSIASLWHSSMHILIAFTYAGAQPFLA